MGVSLQGRLRTSFQHVSGVRELARKSKEVYGEMGLGPTLDQIRLYLSGQRSANAARIPIGPLHPEIARDWPRSVLILAERHIEQCWHYRVAQKMEALDLLGVPCQVAPISDFPLALTRLQLASVLIVYRLPASDRLTRIINDARRLGIEVVYESDDAVYRRDLVAANPNMMTIPPPLRAQVERGAAQNLAALRSATHVIASTSTLAADMSRFVRGGAFVVENGVDSGMIRIRRGLDIQRAQGTLGHDPSVVTLIYGSGSRAHDADLALAADALRSVMIRNPQTRLKLVGPLRLPEQLNDLTPRIKRLPELTYGEFLRELARSDIAIAPLLDVEFNTYKSQIKYLEAALAGVPFMASRTVYGDYVEDGRTGIIARTDREWHQGLERLVAEEVLRRDLVFASQADLARALLTYGAAAQLSTAMDAIHDRRVIA